MARSIAVLAHLGMAVMIVAGMNKALSFGSFVASLSSWTIIPEGFVGVIAPAVVGGELVLGGMWFAGICRLAAARLALIVILVFTSAYLYQYVIAGPPQCECLGRLLSFQIESNQVPLVVLRNVLLTACLIAAIRHTGVPRPVGATSDPTGPQTASGARAGFTLIELLMVIAVITIVAGLALVSFASIRATAAGVSSVSMLRQHGAVFQLYSLDHKDGMPRFIEADGSHNIQGAGGRRIWSERLPYFAHAVFWTVAMADQYYNSIHVSERVFYPPWNRHDAAGIPTLFPYQYAATSVSRPEFWIETERTGPDQWRTIRFSEVVFPSLKVILSAVEDPVNRIDSIHHAHERAHIAWIDGSASVVPRSTIGPGYPGGEGRYEGAWSRSADWPVGSHTRQGVRGRDVQTRER